jgi:hypothetical protein
MVELDNTVLPTIITVVLSIIGCLVLWAGLVHRSRKGSIIPVILGVCILLSAILFGRTQLEKMFTTNAERVVSHYGVHSVQEVGYGAMTSLDSTDQDIPVIFADDTANKNLGIIRVRDGEAQLMVIMDGDLTEYQSR